MANSGHYSGWLGGYAKSVAGSVSAFTQDILEETRADTQDLNSLLKVSNEKVIEGEAKIQALESEISKLKKDLAEVNDDREVTELQLQEVGDRWRAILKEKEEEFKALKEKYTELENEKSDKKVTRLRNMSGDIDFSDPFLCEMEIGRLTNENQLLSNKLEEISTKPNSLASRSDEDGESESKIRALQAQLRSVYIEHQNELAVKDQETERAIRNLREELLRNSDNDTFSRRSSNSETENDAELHRKYSELQFQFKRERGFYKQLEEEKRELETRHEESETSLSKLRKENSALSESVRELQSCRDHVTLLENKLAYLEEESAKSSDTNSGITQYKAAIENLNTQMGEKTIELTNIRNKLSETEHLLSNRDREIHQLRIALNTVQNEDFQELRGLVDSLKIQVDGYKETLKETGHKLLQSNQQVETLSTEQAELSASVSCLTSQNSKHEDTINSLLLQLKAKEDFISELQDSSTRLRLSVSETAEKLEALKAEHQISVRLCNQLKAEKLELVVNSKKVREEKNKLQKEMNQMSLEQGRLQQNGLWSLLQGQITESQLVEIREVLIGEENEEERSSGSSTSSEIRELKRKLADKSEQLRILQGKISKLKSDQVDMIPVSEHDIILSDISSQHLTEITSLQTELSSTQQLYSQLSQQKAAIEEENLVLVTKNSELKNKIDDEKGRTEQSSLSAEKELEFEKKLRDYNESAQKEKTRLLTEIERLMEESGEIEEAYSSAVTEKEQLSTQLGEVKLVLSSLETERENADNKFAKVSENLKKALSRLEVKDAKIEELSDQIIDVEKKLFESNELVEFFRSNQTDEYKAARLGLGEVATPTTTVETAVNYTTSDDVTPYVTSNDVTCNDVTSSDVTPYVSRDRPDDSEVLELRRQVEELTVKMVESETRCGKLTEEIRDKDLKLDLLETEMVSASESSLSEAETNKLIDQNMRLQKVCSSSEREVESLKQQNLELLHQRDFYQDQAKKQHDSMETLRSEANKLIAEANERERRSVVELERLQEHLVKAEETHTEDYLLATRSEQDLRAEVAGLREQILTANQSLDSVRAETSQEITELTSQVHVLSAQRDTALHQLSTAEDNAASCQTSLTNLQIVLEQFQQDREGYAVEIQDQYKRDLEVMSGRMKEKDDTISKLEARVSEIKIIEEDFKASREDSKSKDERIKSLQHEVSKLDVALKVAQEGLQKVRSCAEDKVERSLIKTFFTQYITAPDNRKPEVLRLMTSILNYSEDELEALQRNKDKKWLSSLLSPSSLSSLTPPDKDALSGQSFSELFVSFLETEANRGSIASNRGGSVTTPTPHRPSLTHHRAPSASSTPPFQHQRTPSSASSTSVQSAPVTSTTKEIPASTPDSTSPIPGTLPVGSAPLVVPASLADLLGNKTRS